MASSVATPLERQFGRIAAVTEMTSSSSLGQTSVTLQFDLNRNIDAAARDVQAAINAARGYLTGRPAEQSHLPQGESRRCAHHDPGVDLGSATAERALRCGIDHPDAEDFADQGCRPSHCRRQFGARSAHRCQSNAVESASDCSSTDSRTLIHAKRRIRRRVASRTPARPVMIHANDQLMHAVDYAPLIVGYRNGAAVEAVRRGERNGLGADAAIDWTGKWKTSCAAHHISSAGSKHHRHG